MLLNRRVIIRCESVYINSFTSHKSTAKSLERFSEGHHVPVVIAYLFSHSRRSEDRDTYLLFLPVEEWLLIEHPALE